MARWLLAALYVGSVWMANWFIGNVGTQYEPYGPHVIPVGFGLEAPSGVLWIGVALVVRDLVQQYFGRAPTVAFMLLAAALSYLVAPGLALASGVAFLVSEAADFAVYTPLAERGRFVGAVFLSGTVGLMVDTALFLWLAFGSLQFWQGQVVGKLWVTAIGALALWVIRRRMPRAVPVYASN